MDEKGSDESNRKKDRNGMKNKIGPRKWERENKRSARNKRKTNKQIAYPWRKRSYIFYLWKKDLRRKLQIKINNNKKKTREKKETEKQ